jgi:hypothetical protein
MSAQTRPARSAAIEFEIASLPGVLAVYPVSVLPGAPRVLLEDRGDAARCRLRLAVDRSARALDLVEAVAAAARRAAETPDLEVDVELASID